MSLMKWSAYVSLSMLLIVGCGDFEIVVPDPLSATIVPQHGSIDTSRDVDVFVFFSEPVADRDSALDDIEVRCLGAPPCQQPTSSACTVELPALARSFDGANQTARLVPDTPLQANTCFLITVQAGIEAADSNTGAFPVEVRSSFQTGL